MMNVVNFPASARETVVVKLYSSPKRNGQFGIIIVDPEIGSMEVSSYFNSEETKEMVVKLRDDAECRNFDFEVHDFSSEKELFIVCNDT